MLKYLVCRKDGNYSVRFSVLRRNKFKKTLESREAEREGEKHECERETPRGYLSYMPLSDGAHSLGTGPDWELNQ